MRESSSPTMCHMSHVTCNVSGAKYHNFFFFFFSSFFSFFGQIGADSQWRVSYQQGLTSVVINKMLCYCHLVCLYCIKVTTVTVTVPLTVIVTVIFNINKMLCYCHHVCLYCNTFCQSQSKWHGFILPVKSLGNCCPF